MQCRQLLVFSFICLTFLIALGLSDAKILAECDAVKALKRAGITNTYLGHWVCLMKSESGFDTSKQTGPGAGSSFSYGVFQINSSRWCKRGYKGGECNAKCEDFLNDDISDDIRCAQIIFGKEGFKYWKAWEKKCKNTTPQIPTCKSRRAIISDQYFFFA